MFKPYGSNTQRRQDYEGFPYDDGNIYCINANLIRQGMLFNENHSLIYTDKFQNIEIDDEYDFFIAEQILLKREKEKCQL